MSYQQHQGAPDGSRRQQPPFPLQGISGAATARAPAAGVYAMQYGQQQVRAEWTGRTRRGDGENPVQVFVRRGQNTTRRRRLVCDIFPLLCCPRLSIFVCVHVKSKAIFFPAFPCPCSSSKPMATADRPHRRWWQAAGGIERAT